MYQPFPRERFDGIKRDQWFEELAEHIRPQAESAPYITDLARIKELPREAQAIHLLWMFQAEVAGNGIEYFLLEPQGLFTRRVHEALGLVGGFELIERLEGGIPHAVASGNAEFMAGPDEAWFKRFRENPRFPTFESVDEDIYDLAADDLRDKVNAFIEEHQRVLIA